MVNKDFSIVILAAGKSTRFKSERSKLLHTLAGRPLGDYVARTALAAGPESVLMVVGHDAALVRSTLALPGLKFVEQKQQKGTGHALMVARPQLEKCSGSTVVVVVGDAPLLRTETLRALVEAHRKARAAASILTMRLDRPHGYGRIVRSGGPRVRAIVEEKLCTPAQRKIKEVSSGIICFLRAELLKRLDELSDKNAQKEFLLTDLVRIFNRYRKRVIAFPVEDSREVLGINDRIELAQVERILRMQKAEALMRDGVTLVDPGATYIDAGVEVGNDTVIEPGVSLLGNTRIGRGCTIRVHSTLTDSILRDRVLVRPCTVVTGCEIGSDVILGPFAHLRDGAVVEQEARIGNFVEVKKSRVGQGTKASHLTYLGDATLGRQVNIGAGTVTCNYDGEKKNPTNIGNGVFIGSGSMLVAPVRIAEGSYVAAGSTITEDVPPESLAVGRARQVNKEGWVREHRRPEASSKPEHIPQAPGDDLNH
jgi:bifunctional UDP-N-acetylglucosamine pyrophosphorylase / glucosamine-1-phosphate N-acetyltransferase